MKMWMWSGLAVLVMASGASAQSITYFQNFPGTGGNGSVSLSSYNWTGSYGNSTTPAATSLPGQGTVQPPNAQVSNGGTVASTSPNINAGSPTGSAVTSGVAFTASADNTYQTILSTNEFVISRASFDPTSFSWFGAGNSGDTQRLIVEIGSQWYASTSLLSITKTTTSASTVNANAIKAIVPFNTAANSWRTLQYSIGSNLVLGTTPTALPGGDIGGFGVYIVGGTATADKAFVDGFEVDVPEPTVGLAGFGLLALLRKRRR